MTLQLSKVQVRFRLVLFAGLMFGFASGLRPPYPLADILPFMPGADLVAYVVAGASMLVWAVWVDRWWPFAIATGLVLLAICLRVAAVVVFAESSIAVIFGNVLILFLTYEVLPKWASHVKPPTRLTAPAEKLVEVERQRRRD